MSSALTASPVDSTTPAPSRTMSAADEGDISATLVAQTGHKREASVQLTGITRKMQREALFDIYNTDDWLLVPEHDRKAKRIRIGYLEVRGKKKNVFVVLIAGDISFMVELRESFLTWEKGVHKITYDLSEGQELWVEHNGVAKAWLELQLKALK